MCHLQTALGMARPLHCKALKAALNTTSKDAATWTVPLTFHLHKNWFVFLILCFPSLSWKLSLATLSCPDYVGINHDFARSHEKSFALSFQKSTWWLRFLDRIAQKRRDIMSQKLLSSHIFAVNRSDTTPHRNFTCWSFLLQSRSKKLKEFLFSAFLSLVFESQALTMFHSSFWSMPGDAFLHSERLLVVWMQLQNFTFFLARCFLLKAVPLCVSWAWVTSRKKPQNFHIFFSCHGLCEWECGSTSHTDFKLPELHCRDSVYGTQYMIAGTRRKQNTDLSFSTLPFETNSNIHEWWLMSA